MEIVDRDNGDGDNRTQQQTQLAAAEPSFEFEIDAEQIRLTYQNLVDAQVNFIGPDALVLWSSPQRGARY